MYYETKRRLQKKRQKRIVRRIAAGSVVVGLTAAATALIVATAGQRETQAKTAPFKQTAQQTATAGVSDTLRGYIAETHYIEETQTEIEPADDFTYCRYPWTKAGKE